MNKKDYKLINFLLSRDQDKRLEFLAQEDGCTKSYIIRKLIKGYLKEKDKNV
jgi:predicted DNA-binding protein